MSRFCENNGQHFLAPSDSDRSVSLRVRFHCPVQPGLGVPAMKQNLMSAGIIRCARVRHPTTDLTAESFCELQFLREWVTDRISSVKGTAT